MPPKSPISSSKRIHDDTSSDEAPASKKRLDNERRSWIFSILPTNEQKLMKEFNSTRVKVLKLEKQLRENKIPKDEVMNREIDLEILKGKLETLTNQTKGFLTIKHLRELRTEEQIKQEMPKELQVEPKAPVTHGHTRVLDTVSHLYASIDFLHHDDPRLRRLAFLKAERKKMDANIRRNPGKFKNPKYIADIDDINKEIVKLIPLIEKENERLRLEHRIAELTAAGKIPGISSITAGASSNAPSSIGLNPRVRDEELPELPELTPDELPELTPDDIKYYSDIDQQPSPEPSPTEPLPELSPPPLEEGIKSEYKYDPIDDFYDHGEGIPLDFGWK